MTLRRRVTSIESAVKPGRCDHCAGWREPHTTWERVPAGTEPNGPNTDPLVCEACGWTPKHVHIRWQEVAVGEVRR